MMRLLIIFLILLAGLVLGPILQYQQGYVYIEAGNYEINTSLTSLLIIFLIILFIAYVIIEVVRKIARAGEKSGHWFAQKARHNTNKNLYNANMRLLEGNYTEAERLLSYNAKSSTTPLCTYLQAAEVAQQAGHTQHAKELLADAALVCNKHEKFTFNIVKTRIYLANKEAAAATESVEELLAFRPKHPEVLRLAKQAYQLSGNYEALLAIIPTMYKAHVDDIDKLDDLMQTTFLRLIDQKGQQDASAFKSWWEAQSRKNRRYPIYQAKAARCFIALGDEPAAQKIIFRGLKKTFNPQLITLLPDLNTASLDSIEKCMNNIQLHLSDTTITHQAIYHRVNAALAVKRGEWALAKVEIKQTLAIVPSTEDYQFLDMVNSHIESPIQLEQLLYLSDTEEQCDTDKT